ncbi:MAG: F0F1 ATP synthase subunit epsilon [Armatimonadetes bacterium]|nr:F0F1 ATP synthase subunit epsilon [Armatimonadota bacterium]
MPDKTFKLEIVTPERIVLQQDAVSVIAPGAQGSLGILANHAPLMVELTIGEVDIRDADGSLHRMAVSGGFMEVAANTVRILADTAEKEEEIDVERAREAADRARQRLSTLEAEDLDLARAEAAMKRAVNRMHVARGH